MKVFFTTLLGILVTSGIWGISVFCDTSQKMNQWWVFATILTAIGAIVLFLILMDEVTQNWE